MIGAPPKKNGWGAQPCFTCACPRTLSLIKTQTTSLRAISPSLQTSLSANLSSDVFAISNLAQAMSWRHLAVHSLKWYLGDSVVCKNSGDVSVASLCAISGAISDSDSVEWKGLLILRVRESCSFFSALQLLLRSYHVHRTVCSLTETNQRSRTVSKTMGLKATPGSEFRDRVPC